VPQFVTLQVEDGVGTIRLDRPPMNALNIVVQEEIRAAALEAGERSDVRAVVVYGGPDVFAAGADIKEMVDMTYSDMSARAGALTSAFDAVARIPKPVVAAVTGYALGGGCELALTADFRVCGAGAKLGQPEILLGIIPGGGGTQRLARLIGPARAKDLIFTGRQVGAEEALRIGLVDEVVPHAELHERAMAKAAELARGAVLAQAMAKRAIDRGLDITLNGGLDLEQQLFAEVFATEDAKTGVQSFLDSGPGHATFRGR
jgi:enoyl-CoA hydratase/carnithine racemase